MGLPVWTPSLSAIDWAWLSGSSSRYDRSSSVWDFKENSDEKLRRKKESISK